MEIKTETFLLLAVASPLSQCSLFLSLLRGGLRQSTTRQQSVVSNDLGLISEAVSICQGRKEEERW